jgi:c-di-GMP-binding flagellar brake protein YcgR
MAGKMPLAEYNTNIKINVYNSKQGFRVLVGKVYLSTSKFIRIFDLLSIQDFERRGFFRVDVKMRAKLSIEANEQPEGKHDIGKIVVFVKNISLSGISFSSEHIFQIDDIFPIELKLPGGAVKLSCKVCRIAMGAYPSASYGCKFIDNTDWQEDILCKYIFEIQREQLKDRDK